MQAPKIILIHNHPSGDATPSNADIEFTNELNEAAQMFQIQLLDHLIVGDLNYTSIFSQMLQ